MIVTEIIKYGYAISTLVDKNEYDEGVKKMSALILRRVKESCKRRHRVTAAFGVLSHLKEVSNDCVSCSVLMQDRYCFTFKYKMMTSPLLLKLDKIVEYIECKILSIKSKLFTF